MRSRRPSRRVIASVAAVLVLASAAIVYSPLTWVAEAAFKNTSGVPCQDWTLLLDLPFEDIELYDITEGWVYADGDPASRFQSVTGIANRSKVSHIDFASMHDSHDHNVDIIVDPQYEHLLSPANGDADLNGVPDMIEVEWEIGTYPDETQRNAPERTFPKWAWPNVGDRVWTNGHWIVDCGHPSTVDGVKYFRTEIHPPRAMASMRDQVAPLPGTGQTPVRVTATDLYIHGGAGYVVDVLACGQTVILRDDPDSCPVKTTPIADVYEFDIPLPPRPAGGAALAWQIDDGPGNTIGGVQPVLTPQPAADPTHLRARIDLTGGGVANLGVFAKQIYAGWVSPEELRRLNYTLHRMDLEDDKDLDPGDCECTFSWHNFNRATHAEWLRLSDHANGNMNDYDDWHGFGDGIMSFSGISWDFYVVPGQDFTIRANGYDQDCFDSMMDGTHDLDIGSTVDCYIGSGAYEFEPGKNDKLNEFEATFGPPGYGIGYHEVPADINSATFGDRTFELTDGYELEFTIAEKPVPAGAVTAELSIGQNCVPDGFVAVGTPATCTITIANPGPGLPRDVVVANEVTASSGSFTLGAATYTYPGLLPGPGSCASTGATSFECAVGTVPVGQVARITFPVTATSPGRFTSAATVTSATTDSDPADDTASDEFSAIDLVLDPVAATNELGTPGQTHTVTATLDAGEPVAGEPVAFEIVSGPNAGVLATIVSDAAGASAFTYPARQGSAGLGQDVIRACITDDGGTDLCRDATKLWVDTTPPVVTCPAGPNPSGVIAPPNGQDTGSRFFTMSVQDAVDESPDGYVVDTGSGTVFGPFPSGTNFKYTIRKNAEPAQEPMTGAVQWHISGTGEPAIYGEDGSGNVSGRIACPGG